MSKMTNMQQLRAEIDRLRKQADNEEAIIRNDIASLREQWQPMNLLVNSLSSLTGVNVSKDMFVNNGFVFGLSLVLQRLLLKAENQVSEKVHEWTDALIGKINDFISRHAESPKEK
ncbi:MAG: hypothetical protein ACK5BL_08645 [Flavobacteriales bacterium]|jgi:DNA-binding protein YbaB